MEEIGWSYKKEREGEFPELPEELLTMAARRMTRPERALLSDQFEALDRLPELPRKRLLHRILVSFHRAARAVPSVEARTLVTRLEETLAIVDREKLLLEMEELTHDG